MSDSSIAHCEKVESLRREAERLVLDFGGGIPDAMSRVREYLTRHSAANVLEASPLSMTEALNLVASEQGFEDWSDLQAWHDSENQRLWRRISATRDARVTFLRGILEVLHMTHAQLFMASLSRHFGRPIRVEIGFVDVTTYGEFVASLSRPCRTWTFEAEGFDAAACLNIDLPIAERLVSRDLGGDLGTEVGTIEDIVRQLLVLPGKSSLQVSAPAKYPRFPLGTTCQLFPPGSTRRPAGGLPTRRRRFAKGDALLR